MIITKASGKYACGYYLKKLFVHYLLLLFYLVKNAQDKNINIKKKGKIIFEFKPLLCENML